MRVFISFLLGALLIWAACGIDISLNEASAKNSDKSAYDCRIRSYECLGQCSDEEDALACAQTYSECILDALPQLDKCIENWVWNDYEDCLETDTEQHCTIAIYNNVEKCLLYR